MKKSKVKKLSRKFIAICILPATILLGILCALSINLSERTACKHLQISITNQAFFKVSDLQTTLMQMIDNSDLVSEEKFILGELNSAGKSYEKQYAEIQNTIDRVKTSSIYFNRTEIALFDRDVLLSADNVRKMDKSTEWYNEEKLSKGIPYFSENSVLMDNSVSIATYTYPIHDEKTNEVIGAIIIYMNNSFIISRLKMDTSFSSQIWFIEGKNSKIIFHSKGYNEKIISNLEQAKPDAPKTLTRFNDKLYVTNECNMEMFDNCTLVYIVPKNDIIRNSFLNILIILILTLLSLIIVIFFVSLLTSKIVNEINGIRQSLKKVANKNYSEMLEIKSNDEIGQLVTEFNNVIESLKHQAEHDPLTNFYNSITFYGKANMFIVPDEESRFALIRIDIDNFSFINDIYDWQVGNEILLKIAYLIKKTFSENSIYGYLGTDVFVICLKYKDRKALIESIETLGEKIKKCDERIIVSPHFGIYDDIKDGSNMNIICDYAGVALKTIKGNMLKTYEFYDREFDEKHKYQRFVEEQKQLALDNNQFYIVLQPKCDIETGKVVGAEALVRWKHPDLQKKLSPAKFIPIFEKNGFIITLDKYVWEETCKVLKKWHDKGYRDIPISVNVSRMHIFDNDFVNGLERLTKKYGIPSNLLEVEVTESALLENIDGLLESVMLDLKSRGYKLLMDDFASGYSSLIALKKLPFDVIKIDKGLIDNINKAKNKQLVTGVVSLLNQLNKDIVVEGVEFDWQKEELRDTGCKVIQGFCFSKPLSVEDFERLAFADDMGKD